MSARLFPSFSVSPSSELAIEWSNVWFLVRSSQISSVFSQVTIEKLTDFYIIFMRINFNASLIISGWGLRGSQWTNKPSPRRASLDEVFGISVIVETKWFVQVFICIYLGNQLCPPLFDCGRESWELGFLAVVYEWRGLLFFKQFSSLLQDWQSAERNCLLPIRSGFIPNSTLHLDRFFFLYTARRCFFLREFQCSPLN